MENSFLQNNKVISIVSTKSGMGKTTLIEKLILRFKDKGFKVGVLKHDAHRFEIDKEGKDSYRFTHAGADSVIVASSSKLAMIQNLKEEKSVDEILPLFKDMDFIIIEGFKNNNYPKIEVYRKEVGEKLLAEESLGYKTTIHAIASDCPLEINKPVLDINNDQEICQFIIELLKLQPKF